MVMILQSQCTVMHTTIQPNFLATMVSLEGDDDDSFGEVFGQRHPPLSIYIKGILERYPDGQIFKVRGAQS